MTRRQSNNQLSGAIAALPPPQKIQSAKIRSKILASIFGGIKTASSPFITFQRAKLSTRSIAHIILAQLKDILKEKAPREGHQEGLVLARKCPGSPGTCNPEKTGVPGLPVS